MKRTYKFQALGDVAKVVAAAPNLTVAAKQLGVNRSTLHRWLQSGKVQRASPKAGVTAGANPGETPEGWATAVRAVVTLDPTQGVLLDLAAAALSLARSAAETPTIRLAAMGRYQQLVRQLNLSAAGGQVLPDTKPAAPRPATQRPPDPRVLMMVKK